MNHNHKNNTKNKDCYDSHNCTTCINGGRPETYERCDFCRTIECRYEAMI